MCSVGSQRNQVHTFKLQSLKFHSNIKVNHIVLVLFPFEFCQLQFCTYLSTPLFMLHVPSGLNLSNFVALITSVEEPKL
jgi:hypothetical protein